MTSILRALFCKILEKPSGRLAMRRRLFLRQPEQLEARVLLSGSPVLLDINTDGGSFPGSAKATTLGVFSYAYEPSTGYELYVTDGTTAGSHLVRDLEPGASSSSPSNFTEADGFVFFTAYTSSRGSELWRTDGTTAGTWIVADIYAGSNSSDPSYLTFMNGTLYFSASDGSSGTELWKSNGTMAGTTRIKDINAGSGSSSPSGLVELDNVVLFSAYNTAGGTELWKTSGTSSGTVMVKDIYDGTSSSDPSYLTRVGNSVYFAATDPDVGRELWRSDGTLAGTVNVADINPGVNSSNPYNFMPVNTTTLFFVAYTDVVGTELFKSSGTDATTLLVEDINPGSFGSYPYSLTNVSGALYFSADNGTNGYELWKSTGSAATTSMILDLYPGANGSSPYYLTYLNSKLYFSATTTTYGNELFESDGTATGTKLNANIYDGASSSLPNGLLAYKDYLIFSANDGLHDTELYSVNTRPTVVIDNHNIGYTETGTWSFSSLAGVNGSKSRYSSSTTAKASWSATALTPGYYKVELYKILHSSNATNVNIQVVSAEGTSTQTMSFSSIRQSGWTEVGYYQFSGGATQLVSLAKSSAAGVLRSDAVRFTPVSNPENVDFGSVNHVESGTWSNSSAVGSAASTTRFSSSLSASATYSAAIRAGYYTVQFYLVVAVGSATNAEVTVSAAGKTTVFKVNQTVGVSRWITLGRFYFSGNGIETVSLRNAGTSGTLRSDAVRFFEDLNNSGL